MAAPLESERNGKNSILRKVAMCVWREFAITFSGKSKSQTRNDKLKKCISIAFCVVRGGNIDLNYLLQFFFVPNRYNILHQKLMFMHVENTRE